MLLEVVAAQLRQKKQLLEMLLTMAAACVAPQQTASSSSRLLVLHQMWHLWAAPLVRMLQASSTMHRWAHVAVMLLQRQGLCMAGLKQKGQRRAPELTEQQQRQWVSPADAAAAARVQTAVCVL